MVEVITLLAVALLVAGIAGTLIPLVPGGALSLSGVFLYWWASGFSEPGLLVVAVLTILGVCTLLAEFFGSAIAARTGGASWETTAAAVIVAIVLMLITGPIGLLVGLFGTVFVLEFARNGGDFESSGRSALYATVGVLASSAVQVLLTTTMLFGFVIAVFIF